MVGIVGVHRANDADVINVLTESGQQFTDRHTAFAARPKPERRREQTTGRTLGQQICSLRLLPRILLQTRFGIEQISLKRPPVHEQVNHAFRFGCEVRGARRVRAGRVETHRRHERTGHSHHSQPTTPLTKQTATIQAGVISG